ncbi:hypothetical protein ABK040_001708 [Willaertia magna]
MYNNSTSALDRNSLVNNNVSTNNGIKPPLSSFTNYNPSNSSSTSSSGFLPPTSTVVANNTTSSFTSLMMNNYPTEEEASLLASLSSHSQSNNISGLPFQQQSFSSFPSTDFHSIQDNKTNVMIPHHSKLKVEQQQPCNINTTTDHDHNDKEIALILTKSQGQPLIKTESSNLYSQQQLVDQQIDTKATSDVGNKASSTISNNNNANNNKKRKKKNSSTSSSPVVARTAKKETRKKRKDRSNQSSLTATTVTNPNINTTNVVPNINNTNNITAMNNTIANTNVNSDNNNNSKNSTPTVTTTSSSAVNYSLNNNSSSSKKPKKQKMTFTKEQDLLLIEGVKAYTDLNNPIQWKEINKKLFNNQFTSNFLYQRYHRTLNAKKHRWSNDEDLELLYYCQKHDKKWSQIATREYEGFFPDIQLSNRYKNVCKREELKRKLKEMKEDEILELINKNKEMRKKCIDTRNMQKVMDEAPNTTGGTSTNVTTNSNNNSLVGMLGNEGVANNNTTTSTTTTKKEKKKRATKKKKENNNTENSNKKKRKTSSSSDNKVMMNEISTSIMNDNNILNSNANNDLLKCKDANNIITTTTMAIENDNMENNEVIYDFESIREWPKQKLNEEYLKKINHMKQNYKPMIYFILRDCEEHINLLDDRMLSVIRDENLDHNLNQKLKNVEEQMDIKISWQKLLDDCKLLETKVLIEDGNNLMEINPENFMFLCRAEYCLMSYKNQQ